MLPECILGVVSMEQTFVVKLKENEELLSGIKRVCRRKAVKRGVVMAIGALKEAKLRYFVAPGKREMVEVNKQVEALLFGTIDTKNGETIIHTHIVLGDKREKAIVGHLVEGIVNPVAEIIILPLSVEG